ncbi:MAG: phosphatidylglycerol lysyltransferase domain-containing protein [Solirubrobacteraceae bacterium]
MSQQLQPEKPWPPRLAGAGAVLVGLINIASALSPNIRWRGHLLLSIEPVQAMRVFHALALPAGAALLLVAPYLAKRRRRAVHVAIVLLLALAVVNMLKGLDFEESLISLAAAGALFKQRGAFTVDHDAITLRSAVWRAPLLGLAGLVAASVACWVSEGRPSATKVLGETWALLRYRTGPLQFERHSVFHHHLHFAWIPLGVHFVELTTLVAIAYVIFRPLAAPRALPGPAVRGLVVDVIRAYGRDSLSFFKLRSDKQYFFSAERIAFVGYRVEAGVMLLSGDPVGPESALGGLLAEVRAFARAHGLKLGVIGASERLLPLYHGLGLRTLYLGDEAIIETGSFSLQGRAIRKVRQSVSRLQKAGFGAELATLATLERGTLSEIETVLERGRLGAPERGFSMAMDSIRGDCEADTLFVLARDAQGAVRGVLHFVPCYGRPAVSLSFMRRDPDTPNGLTEFLVTQAVELLRERGIEELSLNFATAARFMNNPRNRTERILGKGAAKLNRYFQIESLYRFNAKFFPRWEPRYAVYEGLLGLPRMSLAGMWAEGQLLKPQIRRRRLRAPDAARRGPAPITG